MSRPDSSPPHGRGAVSNSTSRYEQWRREAVDDGWEPQPVPPLRTTLSVDACRSVISYNDSPDVPFDRSVNPFRGCEHGCAYCFARPTHARLGLSPGLDFEARLSYKPDAVQVLERELASASYRCAPLVLGINTDAYQPVERELGLTRALLAVLGRYRHPVVVVTKSALIERDLDLLKPMAEVGLVQVVFSISTMKPDLARRLEPRAASPRRRLEAMARLHQAGIPVGIFAAPVIPVLTDPELEEILARARDVGAGFAEYILLRLPGEVNELFRQWLQTHVPLQAEHVMARLRDCHGGRDYDSRFGSRMVGSGNYAALLGRRFQVACKRLGLGEPPALDCSAFDPPSGAQLAGQMRLF